MLLNDLQSRSLISPPRWLPDNCLYLVQMGSVAYGVSDDNSDIDVYGYAMPPKTVVFPHLAGEIFGFGKQKERFGQWQQHHIEDKEKRKEYDFSIYSIVKYFDLVMSGNPNMIDSLFTPQRCILHTTKIGDMVRENRHLFLHKGCFHKFKGFAFQQFHKMKTKGHKYIDDLMNLEDKLGIPRVTTLKEATFALFNYEDRNEAHWSANIDHNGLNEYVELYEKMVSAGKRSERCKIYQFDTKFAYHIIRLVSECEQILSEHTLVLDEKGRREHMKAVRNGEWTIEQVEDHFAQKEKHLEDLYQSSTLQHKPDEAVIKDLLLNCLEHHYGSLDACVVNEDQAVRVLRDVAALIDKNRSLI